MKICAIYLIEAIDHTMQMDNSEVLSIVEKGSNLCFILGKGQYRCAENGDRVNHCFVVSLVAENSIGADGTFRLLAM
jgi:sialic acid synthase SpsE